MAAVIDTSSLLSLVRYYLPFDKEGVLFDLIKKKIEAREIIILDKVYDECKYVAKGIVVGSLKYINEIKYHVKTEDLLPTPKFFRQLENNFINKAGRKKLSPVEFEHIKGEFLESADAKLLLYCLRDKGGLYNPILVTEESEASNDNKSFKKLPTISKSLGIEVLTLPELLNRYPEINLEIK